jgi:hypothetical protein
LPSIRELGHNPRTAARHGPQPRYGCGLVVDPFGQYAQIVDLRRPGTTPPRHRPDSTNPPSVHHSTDNPQPVSAQSPTQGRQTTKQSVQPAYGETVTPAPRSVWPPRHLRKANPPDGPSGLRPPLMESPLRGRYPPLHKPSTAQAGHKRRQGRPTRPTRHYPLPSWRRPPMTTQATTTYDELCPAVTKPTAPTGCKAHRPWTPERAATAASNGR